MNFCFKWESDGSEGIFLDSPVGNGSDSLYFPFLQRVPSLVSVRNCLAPTSPSSERRWGCGIQERVLWCHKILWRIVRDFERFRKISTYINVCNLNHMISVSQGMASFGAWSAILNVSVPIGPIPSIFIQCTIIFKCSDKNMYLIIIEIVQNLTYFWSNLS